MRRYSLPRPDKGNSSGLGLSATMKWPTGMAGRLTLANRPEGGALAELWLPLT